MKLRRKFASLLAFIMAFSSLASFSVLGDVVLPEATMIDAFGAGIFAGEIVDEDGDSFTAAGRVITTAVAGTTTPAPAEQTVELDVLGFLGQWVDEDPGPPVVAGHFDFTQDPDGEVDWSFVGFVPPFVNFNDGADGALGLEDTRSATLNVLTPPAGTTIGDHPVTVRATQTITEPGMAPTTNIAEITFTIRVVGQAAAPDPVVTLGGNEVTEHALSIVRGQTANVVFGADWVGDFTTGADTAATNATWTLVGLPTGLAGTVLLTPLPGGDDTVDPRTDFMGYEVNMMLAPGLAAPLGEHEFTLRVTRGTGAAAEVAEVVITLTVLPVQPPTGPVITLPAAAETFRFPVGSVDNTVQFTATGFPPPGWEIENDSGGHPAFTIGATTGLLTVTTTDPGTRTFTLVARNDEGTSRREVTLIVYEDDLPPVRPEYEAIREARPLSAIPGQNVFGFVGNTDSHWMMYDRILDVTGAAPALIGGRATHVAPELVIPASQLNPQGGTIELTLTGWGNAVWSAAWATAIADGRVLEYSAAEARFGPNMGTLLNPIRLQTLPRAEAAGFTFGTDGVLFYSGLRVSGELNPENPTWDQFPHLFNELPLAIRWENTRLIIYYPPMSGVATNTVLRFPLIAQGVAGVDPTVANHFTNIPTLTLVRGHQPIIGQDAPARQLPYVNVGAGVTLQVENVRIGRNFVGLDELRLVGAAGAQGAFRENGQIVLTLPLGHRWDPSAQIVLGRDGEDEGIGANATIFIPSNAHNYGGALEIPRDGITAQSILVIQLGAIPPLTPGVANTLFINGLQILPAGGIIGQIQESDVHVYVGTGLGTEASWGGTIAARNWYTGTNRTFPVDGVIPPHQTRDSLNVAFSSIAPAYALVAQFRDFDVTFQRTNVTGAPQAGNISTIVAGWLPGGPTGSGPNVAERISGRVVPTANVAARGNVATVRFEEVVPNSAWTAHSLTFTLVDAEGNPHQHASIYGVDFRPSIVGVSGVPGQIHAGTTGGQRAGMPSRVQGFFYNAVNAPEPSGGSGNGMLGTFGGASVNFNTDGNSVTIANMRLGQDIWDTGRIRIDAHFAITADVNYVGPVYIAVTDLGRAHGGAAFGVIELDPVHVANVRRGIEVEAETTYVQVGFQTVNVADILIREMEVGDFRTGRNIRIALGEYMTGQVAGQSNVQFIPIGTLQINDHIEIGGAAREQDRVIARLQPSHQAADTLHINIIQATRGTVPSYIRLHGLQVRVIRDVPYGTYELVVRGTSVLDNENFYGDINMVGAPVPGAPDNRIPMLPTANGFRRYPHGPLMLENYIVVATPGAGPGGVAGTARIVIPFAPGSTFTVNEEERTFLSGTREEVLAGRGIVAPSVNFGAPLVINTVEVPQDRLFVPLRSVIYALGGNIENFVAGNLYEGRPHTIEVRVGDRVVFFSVGRPYYTVLGAEVPLVIDGISISPFIGDGTNGTIPGTTYLPLRAIINAFNLNYGYENQAVVINP